jgi:glycosyltransferase involved in cell wall biosynthesis
MACGLPLLANEACGVREVATHREHGWVGDFSTVSRLAQGLESALCAPPATLQDMGSRSRQRITEHFARDRMLMRYEHLYSLQRPIFTPSVGCLESS